MDKKLMELEERLASLVPRALSDEGRDCLEEHIEVLAQEAGEEPSAPPSRWIGWSAAACMFAGVGMFLVSSRYQSPSVTTAPELEGELPKMEFITTTREVREITDAGWVLGDGSERPHRYWGFLLTDTEKVIDEESGYAVTILSEREEWIPVTLTQL